MLELLDMFFTFLKIGSLSFGGGYAMIPFLQREVCDLHGWLSITEFIDIVAVSQITPGPVAVNMATFVGYRELGMLGSVFATLGVCLPSFLLISIAFHFLKQYNNSGLVKNIFLGLRPAVVGLIAFAAFQLVLAEFLPNGFVLEVELGSVLIFGLTLVAALVFKISPMICIAGAAVLGLILF